MHAVVIHETGNPDVLHYEEADRPEPGDGEVLIRVRAASVNPADWKARRGSREVALPAVLGLRRLRDGRGVADRGASPRATTCSAWPRVAATRSSQPPRRP